MEPPMHFSLIGPDIGVKKLDLAGLLSNLGEDLGTWAASAANTDAPIEIPNQPQRRLIRVHKPGDEALGYDYFARRVRDPIEPAPANPAPPRKDDGEEPEKPVVSLVAEEVANGTKSGRLVMYEAEYELVIRIPRRAFAFAPPGRSDMALDAIRRVGANEDQHDDAGVVFDAAREADRAYEHLVAHDGNYAAAGWQLIPTTAKELSPEMSNRVAQRIFAEQIRAFQENLGTYLDDTLAVMQRAGSRS